MHKQSTQWMAIALTVALLPVGGAVVADDGDDFEFRLGEITLETLQTDVDTDSAKFQEYRDLRSGFRLPRLRLYGESADGDRTFEFRGDNVDREDARYTIDYGVAGQYSFTFDYNRIQHLFGNNGTFLYGVTSPARLEIPDPLQAAFEDTIRTAGQGGVDADLLGGLVMPFQAASEKIDLSLQRDRTHARLDINKMGQRGLAVDVRHEKRSGRRPYAGSFGFGNVIEIFEPTDYETTDVELSGGWNADQGGVRLGVRRSMFENDNSTLVWDNPFFFTDSTDSRAYLSPGSASINGPSTGFADLAPDNDASSFFIDGKFKNDSGWRFTGSATYSKLEQDDPLLPYTLNAAIVGIDHETGATFDPTNVANLPAQSADGEVVTTAFNANIAKQLGEDFELTLRYRYYDYDNRSPRIEFPGYVRFHAVWEEVPRVTVPYAYTRDDIGLELAWDANERNDFTVSFYRKSWDREFREIDSSDEDIFEIAYNARPSDRVGLRASWQTGDRSISDYRVEAQLLSFLDDEEVNNQPLLRKFDEAERDFDDYALQLRLFPSDSFSVVLGLSTRNEDYGDSRFGLVNDDVTHWNAEFSYTPSAQVSFFIFADVADRESSFRSRQSGGSLSTNPLDDWDVTFNEDNNTFGAGLTADSSESFHWELSANWSESDGEADFFTPVGGRDAVDIDNYEDIELLSIKLDLSYDLTQRAQVGLKYLYEDYVIDSFNQVGIVPYIPSTILLAASNGDYQADVISLYLKLSR